jgi:serine/threonine-protein kinase
VSAYQAPEPGSTAAPTRLGRYELLGLLATGGMGEIHLARLAGEADFAKVVVVKRLLPELCRDPAFVAMFLEEARLASRLAHPNVCEVFDLGRDGAEHFIAMPYLVGLAATGLLARPRTSDRRGELRVVGGVIAQACAGLHHAHQLVDDRGAALHLVHRDVSPSNLFVTTAGVVKLLDFGIAKVRGGDAATALGTIKGKYPYMSPEQVRGDELDRRSDLFSLGIVLFELATHQRLFKRPSDYLTAKAILEEPLPRADATDPAIPAEVADVIARALARDRGDRFTDAHALGDALTAALAPLGGPATPVEIAAALAADHDEELTAQRTRQARVVAAAAARGAGSPAGTDHGDHAHGAPGTLGGGAASAAIHRDVPRAEPAPSAVVTRALTPRRPSRRRAPRAILIAGALVGVGAALAVVAGAFDGCNDAPPPARPSVAIAATTPDAALDLAAGAPPTPDAARGSALDAPPPEIEMPVDRTTRRPPPGLLSVDSTPYATIFVDGHRLGLTPLLRLPLTAGHHRLRAVLADGRSREVDVDVPAGRAAPPLRLTW